LSERIASFAFAQPIFQETSIHIRRICHDPLKPDITQHLTSISSSLNANDDPASDFLPYGGRKSSVSFTSSHPDLIGTVGIPKTQGREPSMSYVGEGPLQVRRVSAGGGEDMVRVRGASLPCIPEVQGEGHPAAIPASQSPQVLTIRPTIPTMRLSAPPPPKKPMYRPDSVILTLTKSPSLTATSTTNSTSTMELESLMDGESPGGVFSAWHGFPPKTETEDTTGQGDHSSIKQPLRERQEGRRISSLKVTHLAESTDEGMQREEGPPVIPLPDGLDRQESGLGIII